MQDKWIQLDINYQFWVYLSCRSSGLFYLVSCPAVLSPSMVWFPGHSPNIKTIAKWKGSSLPTADFFLPQGEQNLYYLAETFTQTQDRVELPRHCQDTVRDSQFPRAQNVHPCRRPRWKIWHTLSGTFYGLTVELPWKFTSSSTC